MERVRAVKRKKGAVGIIEKFWSKYISKLELRKTREKLRNLPWDCKELWLRLNSAKLETSALKQELNELIIKGCNF